MGLSDCDFDLRGEDDFEELIWHVERLGNIYDVARMKITPDTTVIIFAKDGKLQDV